MSDHIVKSVEEIKNLNWCVVGLITLISGFTLHLYLENLHKAEQMAVIKEVILTCIDAPKKKRVMERP